METTEKYLFIYLESWDWREYRESMWVSLVGIPIRRGIETGVATAFSQAKLPEEDITNTTNTTNTSNQTFPA